MRAANPLPMPIPVTTRWKCVSTRMALCAICLGTASLAVAVHATPQSPAAVPRKTAQRPARVQTQRAKPAPGKLAEPAPPPAPNWPINDKPNLASVTLSSGGLRIEASNSSLRQILHDVATVTGAKVEGMTEDERVFGTYGPGPARDVIAQLLHGSGYNVLLIGDQGQGAPRQIVLSQPTDAGASTASNAPPAQETEDEPEPADRIYPANPQPPNGPVPPGFRPPFNRGVPVRSPQQIMEEMQQRQRQIQNQTPQQ